ncbi:MAG: hypothetical protein LC657_18595, partial [Desulfobacteraceae bacterium]|nr:hypothetical protein [Desulfobacteraceae bacterium]
VTVDPSVWERYTQDPTYRPRTMVNKGLKPPNNYNNAGLTPPPLITSSRTSPGFMRPWTRDMTWLAKTI